MLLGVNLPSQTSFIFVNPIEELSRTVFLSLNIYREINNVMDYHSASLDAEREFFFIHQAYVAAGYGSTKRGLVPYCLRRIYRYHSFTTGNQRYGVGIEETPPLSRVPLYMWLEGYGDEGLQQAYQLLLNFRINTVPS